MKFTSNYKLKKLEDGDPIDILDIGENMDILDRELKKKAETSGGDVSKMTVKTLKASTAEFPIPEAGEDAETFLGKVKKFFEDTKNWMTGVCMLGQLVNNCVTNRSDLPLAAAQGKVLMDLYTQLNSDLIDRGIVEPQSGEAIINTDWVSSGMVVYRIVNGLCCVDFDVVLKPITLSHTLIATGLPRALITTHIRTQDWEDKSRSTPFYISGSDMTVNPGEAGHYVGSFVYAIK